MNLALCLVFLFSATVHADTPPAEPTSSFKYELRTAPIAYYAQWFTYDLAILISEKFTAGPAVIYYASGGPGGFLRPNYKGYSIGANATYYGSTFTTDGFYLNTHIYYDNYESFPHAFLGSKNYKGLNANFVLGYRFVAPNQITTLFGIGTQTVKSKVIEKSDYDPQKEFTQEENYPYFEFKMGYIF